MAFGKGNEIWRMRKKDGRNCTYANSDDLWDACVKYFEWIDENPIIEHKPTQFGGAQVDVFVEHKRPMTKEGLSLMVGVTQETWGAWSKPDHDFFLVSKEVNEIIYDNKFAGASVGLFNANIIARDLGLSDKKDLSSSDGTLSPIDSSSAVLEALARKHK
jgi:hypothetical protein